MRNEHAIIGTVIFTVVIAAALIGSAVLYAVSASDMGPSTPSLGGLNNLSIPDPSLSQATDTSSNVTVSMTSTTTSAPASIESSIVTTQFNGTGANNVVQSCAGFGNASLIASCKLASPVKVGDLILVDVA